MSVSPGLNNHGVDAFFAQGLDRFQPVQPFNQDIAILPEANLYGRFLAILQNILCQGINAIPIQKLAGLARHVNPVGLDNDGLH